MILKAKLALVACLLSFVQVVPAGTGSGTWGREMYFESNFVSLRVDVHAVSSKRLDVDFLLSESMNV